MTTWRMAGQKMAGYDRLDRHRMHHPFSNSLLTIKNLHAENHMQAYFFTKKSYRSFPHLHRPA